MTTSCPHDGLYLQWHFGQYHFFASTACFPALSESFYHSLLEIAIKQGMPPDGPEDLQM